MELQRRYGAGRLAEIFGKQALPLDRQMRVLGLYRAAEAEIPFLVGGDEPRARRLCGRGQRFSSIAPWCAAARVSAAAAFRPKPWRPADSLVWGKLMALAARRQLPRGIAARPDGADDLARRSRLSLSGIPERRTDDPCRDAADLSPAGTRRLVCGAAAAAWDRTYASNNWVVDGRHSASGKPLLANDPHLAFAAPGFWYLARLKTPQHDIAGATAAGAPLVVIGHNERIAWGFTTTTADVEDLFIEKVDPADPGRYLTPQGSAAVPIPARDDPGQGRGAGRA